MDQRHRQDDRREFHNRNAFKIGLFGANCSSGRAVTTVPERWSGGWEDNLGLARMADSLGIDFLLPIARWKGYGGETDYEGASLEAISWATGLLASTERIGVFATVHVPLVHPIVAAKAFATADHVGRGRFGLNIVCGWNDDEFTMFGVDLREHEQRYAYAQEWIDIVTRIWAGGPPFDYQGEFIKLMGVTGKPAPYGGTRPLLMNAAVSANGQAFAFRNCEALFTGVGDFTFDELAAHVRGVKEDARALGRDIDVYTVGVMTCRATAREAQEYYRYSIIENADWGAVDNIIKQRQLPIDTFTPQELQATRERLATGMGGMMMVGDPDHVAAQIAQLSAAGLRGIGVSVVNYALELPFFAQEVLPRLERMGLRARVS